MAYIDSPQNPVQCGEAIFPARRVRKVRVPTWLLILMAYAIVALMSMALMVAPDARADVTSCTAAEVAAVEYEDDPCWTWTRHGNGARGVILTNGRTAIVGACEFQRRWYGRSIDRKRTPRLRGDWFARTRGCGFDVRNY